MNALAIGLGFFLGINLFFWGAFHIMERMYDRHLSRKLARLRHPSAQRTYPTSNVKVVA